MTSTDPPIIVIKFYDEDARYHMFMSSSGIRIGYLFKIKNLVESKEYDIFISLLIVDTKCESTTYCTPRVTLETKNLSIILGLLWQEINTELLFVCHQ